jgi:hypothetical protein
MDNESLGEEAGVDGGAVEEVKQAEEWQIVVTKRAAMVVVSNKHGEASLRVMALAASVGV